MRVLKSLTLGVLVLLFCLSNIAPAQADEIDRLINQLKEAESCREAAFALGEIGDPRAVEPLIDALKDRDWRIQEQAARALGKIGDPRALEPLTAALKDADNNVARGVAAKALGEIGDSRAVEPLVAVLKDGDWRVRGGAAEALGKIGDPRAVEPLVVALEDNDVREDWYVRKVAAEALGRIGDSRAVEPLISVLKDENQDVRWTTAEALGKIGDSRAVKPLIATLKDQERNVRKAAAEALGNIGDSHAVEPLIAALKDRDWRIQGAAAEALGNIGDSHAVEPLAAILIETISNKDKYGPYPYHLYCAEGRGWQVPWAAAEALGNIGDSRAVKPLATALKDVDWRIRVAAAEALGEIGDARAVESLAATLKDEDNDVRRAAAEALGNIGDSRAVKPLATALKDVDWRIRVAAAEALGKIGDPRAVEPLVVALKDENRYVQYKAAKVLDKLGRKAKNESEKALYLLFAKDISEILRKRIKVCIGKFYDVSKKRVGRLEYYDPPAKIPYYNVNEIFLYMLKENLTSEGYEVVEKETDNYEIKIGGVLKAEAKEWQPIRMKDIFSFGLTRIGDSFPPFMASGVPWRDYVKIQVTVNYSIDNKVIKKRYTQAMEKEGRGSRRRIVQVLSQRISSEIIEHFKNIKK